MSKPKSKSKPLYLHVPLTPEMNIGLLYLSKHLHISKASLAKIMLGKGISLKLISINDELEYEEVMENLAEMQSELIEETRRVT